LSANPTTRSRLGTAEVVGAAWMAIAEEVGTALIRTAISPNVKERRDCSAAVFSASGQLLAQAAHIPLHISCLMGFPEHLAHFPDLAPGDIYASNDPYLVTHSHLNDIALAMGVFHKDQLIAFVANIAHHPDVGGAVPGSETPNCTEVYQEGLRIPPIRLYHKGRVDEALLRLITMNSRLPDVLESDLQAQVAACQAGALRIAELAERYGVEQLEAASNEWLNYTEHRFRQRCGEFDGLEFSIDEELDDDGMGGPPVNIVGTGSIGKAGVSVDLRRSGPQVAGATNAPVGATRAAVYFAIKSIVDPGCPNNEGYFRAIDVSTTPGTVVHPVPPAAVGHRICVAQKLANGIFRGVAEADSSHGSAQAHGACVLIFSGHVDGRSFVNYEAISGGYGGNPIGPGANATMAMCTNSSNLPVEVMEHEYPLRVKVFSVRKGSAGQGQHAGGDGLHREVEVLCDKAELTVALMDARVAPKGARGGLDGLPARCGLISDGTLEWLPIHATHVPLKRGDVLVVETAGGGGWGRSG
jgi:N-methylhydantoinase B